MHKTKKNHSYRRLLASLLALCITLSGINAGLLVSYATPSETEYQVGENVTATLYGNGLLRLSGSGDTWDYTDDNKNCAPFYQKRGIITAVEIGDGITSIGSYLFYNCEKLTDTLTIPRSVVRIGDYAFSGDSGEHAPSFSYLINKFVETDITVDVDEHTRTQKSNDSAFATSAEVPAHKEATDELSQNDSLTIEENSLSVDNTEKSSTADSIPTISAKTTIFDENVLLTDTSNSTHNSEPPITTETPIYEVTHITEQDMGVSVFFADQIGVYKLADSQNESFRESAVSAGYAEVLSNYAIELSNEFGETKMVSIPMSDQGLFLPDYLATELAWPDESHTAYQFAGWMENSGEFSTQAKTHLAHSFYSGEATSFTAVFTAAAKPLTQQKIFADVGKQRVTISGMLPKNAQVFAELVPVETATVLAGDYVPDASMVVVALDITIMVDGVKYQPQEYGESVTVSISNIEASPTANQSLTVLHIDENKTTEDAVTVIEGASAVADKVDFSADSFSVYIVTISNNYTLTFPNGAYSLLSESGEPLTDEDTATEGIQFSTNSAFFKCKIVPNANNMILGVKAVAEVNGENAMVYGYADNAYTISRVTANQTITVSTALSKTITYHINRTGETTTYIQTFSDGNQSTIAFPVNIGFAAASGSHFVGWNTKADNSGTTYAAGQSGTLSDSLMLYAQWSGDASPLKAVLYDSNAMNSAHSTELSEGGAVGNGWDYNHADRYLEISGINFQSQGGTLSITLPTGMALFDDNYTQPSGNINSVAFTKLAGLSGSGGQGVGTHSNNRTGTLTYTFAATATNERVLIPVTFDQYVWNKNVDSVNLSGEQPPITVSMTVGAGATAKSYVKTLSKVCASVKYDNYGSHVYGSYVPTVALIGEEPVTMSYCDIRNVDTFWRSTTVEYILPHDSENNYAEYVKEPAEGVDHTGGGKVDASDPTRIIYSWTDSELPKYLYSSPVLKFPASKFTEGETLNYTVKFTGISYTGAVISHQKPLTIKVVGYTENVVLRDVDAQFYSAETDSASVQHRLGQFLIQNDGMAPSGKKQLTFNFDTMAVPGKRNNIDVIAFSLPLVNETITATCTMMDANNSNSFTQPMTLTGKSDIRNGCMLLARDVAAACGKNDVDSWYFRSVTYELPAIPAQSALYHGSAPAKFDELGSACGGLFYGKSNSSGVASSTLTLKSWNDTTSEWESKTEQSATASTLNTSSKTIPLYIDSIMMQDGTQNSVSIKAGDTLEMDVRLAMHYYPYGTTQYSVGQTVYFIAPRGVTLQDGGVSAKWSDASPDTISTSVTSRSLSDGDTLYAITLTGSDFGGPQLQGGTFYPARLTRKPVISLSMKTAANMTPLAIILKNNLFVMESDGKIINTGIYIIKDTRDLDNDRNIEENIGTYDSNSNKAITITANTNQLTFTAEAKMHDEPDTRYRSGTDATSRLYLSAPSDRVDYRLVLTNKSGSIVPGGNFMYYIPIPKSTGMPAHMKTKDPQFNLNLNGPVTVTGANPNLYDVRYSTDANDANYDNGKSDFTGGTGLATWQEEGNITDWSNVTMIKVVTKSGIEYLPTDTKDYFNLSLSYAGTAENILNNAGKISDWNSCGVQKYSDDGQNIKGIHTPTEQVGIMLRYEHNDAVTLTASNGTPTGGAVKTATLSSPSFTLAKDIQIISITTENVTLQSSKIVSSNANTATGETANGCFAITAKLNNGIDCELSGGEGQSLGSTVAGMESKLVFTLTNYNNLSDILTSRSVTLVLGDGAGIQFTVTITIDRQVATVTAETHIDSGKFYNPISGKSGSTSITADSAFTAQYVLTYKPSVYSGHKISLLDSSKTNAVNFPLGTKLTLLDLTDSAAPKYYYYKVTNAVETINLTDFSGMGGGANYTHPTATLEVKETLLIIADFSSASLTAGNYTLRMTLMGSTPSNTDLSITATQPRKFSLSAIANSSTMDRRLTVNGTAGTTQALTGDSRWLYRKMALVLMLKDSSNNQIAFPEGTVVTMNGMQYVPSGNNIVLPLGSLGNYDYSYTLSTPHTALLSGSTYTLTTQLYISATAEAKAPLGGDKVKEEASQFTAFSESVCALKLDIESDKKLFTKAETAQLPLNIHYNTAAQNAAITLELQEKAGDIYLTRTNLITNALVNGTQYLVNNYGVLQLPSSTYTANGLTVALNTNVNNLVVGGTYRILAKAVGNGKTTETVYTFVIIE